MSVAGSATATARPADGEFIPVRLSQISAGARLQSPVYDARPGQAQLLLAAGKQLTPAHLDSLSRRGIQSVLIHKNDWARINSPNRFGARIHARVPRQPHRVQSSATSVDRSQQGRASWSGWNVDSDSFLHQVQPVATPQRDPLRVAEFQKAYEVGLNCTTSLITHLVQDRELNGDAVTNLSDQHLKQVSEDLDEFLHRGVAPISSDYPSRHCLQTAMLATSMATLMGHHRDELLALGFGCLLHDAGMLLVPPHLLQATGKLSAADKLELQKHPMLIANLLQDRRDVPHAARHIVYQMHERMNGSGYPRGRSGQQIHPLARIAAVADTYLALTSPRPFRAPLQPYQAVEHILFAARQGLLDPGPVRALLHAISLFPIGSYVQLNDGRVGQVIRTNREEFARPKVQIQDPLSAWEPEFVDLKERRELSVIGTLDPTAILPHQSDDSDDAALRTAAASL